MSGAHFHKRITVGQAECARGALVRLTDASTSLRPSIFADADVLKHIYSFLPPKMTLEHMLVSREFMRVLSSTIDRVTISPAAPVERLLARFSNATHIAVVGVHCPAGLRAGAAAHAHACAVQRLCVTLPRCAKLVSLDLTRCMPCDAALAQLSAALPRCAGLRELCLDQFGAPTSDAAIAFYAALARMPSLDALYVSMAHVRLVQHALMPMLSRYRCLAALDLSLNGLGAQGATLLRTALPGCAQLASLNLASNSLGDGGIELLAPTLPHCANLTALNLTANSIRAAGALALAMFLPACPSIRHLWLGLNALGGRGVEQLAAVLPSCRCAERPLLACLASACAPRPGLFRVRGYVRTAGWSHAPPHARALDLDPPPALPRSKLCELELTTNQLPPDALCALVPACFRAHALVRLDVRHNEAASSDAAVIEFLRAVVSMRACADEALLVSRAARQPGAPVPLLHSRVCSSRARVCASERCASPVRKHALLIRCSHAHCAAALCAGLCAAAGGMAPWKRADASG